MMIRKILLGFSALAVTSLCLHDAHAQIAGAGAASISGANAGSASQSRSISGGGSGTAGANSTATNGAQASTGASGVTFNQGNGSPVYNNTPSDVIVRSAPTVYVPNIVTGNVCALGASAGASWLGAGVAAGMSWESMQCERRQTAALLWNMGTPESRAAAKAVVCNSPEIRAAYSATGSPCPADVAQGQPVLVQQQPIAPQSIPPQPTTVGDPRSLPRCSRTVTDNCWGGPGVSS